MFMSDSAIENNAITFSSISPDLLIHSWFFLSFVYSSRYQKEAPMTQQN